MKLISVILIATGFSQMASAKVSCSAEWNSGAIVDRAPVAGIPLGTLEIGFNEVKGTDRYVEFQSLKGRFAITLHSSKIAEMSTVDFYDGITAPVKLNLSFKNQNGDKENVYLNCQDL